MQAEKSPKSVVILGAGLAGLSAAWVLAKNGFQVVVLEKSSVLGGLAITKERNGYKYDLGPHNIHTIQNHIVAFLSRHFSKSFFSHDPRSKILKNRRYIDYPLRGVTVLTSLPVWKLPSALLSFLLARIKMFFGEPISDASFQAWIQNRFGKLLFREYFGGYARKVWCIPPDQIDKYVCEKRIPVIGLTELLRTFFLGKPARTEHPEFSVANYYLRQGIGETVDFFTRELDYCSTVLMFIEVRRRNILPSAMLYFSDPKVPFSRIYDVGMYSAAMVPEGKTMLCVEMPCNFGDETWNTTAELALSSLRDILVSEKILRAEEIEGAFLEKISHSYPRFRLGFLERVQNCFRFQVTQIFFLMGAKAVSPI